MNPCREYSEIDILFVDLYRSGGSKWREPTVTLGKFIVEEKVSGISTLFGVPACIDLISLHWYIYYSWSFYAMFDFMISIVIDSVLLHNSWCRSTYSIMPPIDQVDCYDFWHMMTIALHRFYWPLAGISVIAMWLTLFLVNHYCIILQL